MATPQRSTIGGWPQALVSGLFGVVAVTPWPSDLVGQAAVDAPSRCRPRRRRAAGSAARPGSPAEQAVTVSSASGSDERAREGRRAHRLTGGRRGR